MTTGIDTVAEARQAAKEAAELASALQERVRDGDATVTVEALANADYGRKFAELQAEAAERAAEAEQAREAREDAASLVEELPTIEDEDAKLVKAWTAAVKSLAALADAAQARSARIDRAVSEMAEADTRLKREADTTLADLGVLPARFGGVAGFQVPDAGIDILDVPVGLVLASAAHEGLGINEMHAMASRINTIEPNLAASTTGQSIVGWVAAIEKLQGDR